MKQLIAQHWQSLALLAFAAFCGVVMLVKGVREYRARKSGGISVP
jgi:hypothetical protein